MLNVRLCGHSEVCFIKHVFIYMNENLSLFCCVMKNNDYSRFIVTDYFLATAFNLFHLRFLNHIEMFFLHLTNILLSILLIHIFQFLFFMSSCPSNLSD